VAEEEEHNKCHQSHHANHKPKIAEIFDEN
jgi:hypothetical protein